MKQTVIDAINAQIAKERDASVVYESLSIWCATKDYPGFAEFFSKQAAEEREHAEKLVHHLVERGATPVLGALDAPPAKFAALIDVARAALAHEESNTRGVNTTLEVASAEGDYPAQVMLSWFVSEQVEEEAWANRMVTILTRLTGEGALYNLDRHIVEDLTGGE